MSKNMRKVGLNSRALGILSHYTILGTAPVRERCADVPAATLIEPHFTTLQRYSNFTHTIPFSTKKMDEEPLDSDIFCNDDCLKRRPSTIEDEKTVVLLLQEIIEYHSKNVSNWIVESKLKTLCNFYKCLLKMHKHGFINVLATEYAVNHKEVCEAARVVVDNEKDNAMKVARNEEQLRSVLTPEYSWLFMHIGRLEGGVKFLVDLRTDILESMSEIAGSDGSLMVALQQLNNTLRDLLSMWFSVGFLDLERVTWRSSCEMLQKISEYEAVHPVRSWIDLKRRVGPYRRCFVFLHSSMPGEPLVVLHTALCDEIPASMKGIVSARSRMSMDAAAGSEMPLDPLCEDPLQVKAAIFYSITSTQKGLQGIELGNYLIKRVVSELQLEFPDMTQFSSLSPIPALKPWLMDKVKLAEKGHTDVLTADEISKLRSHLNCSDFWREVKRLLNSNGWVDDPSLAALLRAPLMRLCSRYLLLEKRRGCALDSVANFHLRNGAVMWRVNWQSDLSPRGLSNSCGMMVNYRYFLDKTEANSRLYLEQQRIEASEQVQALADQAQQLMVVSKM